MASYANIPAGATLDVKPFQAHVDEEKLQHFKQLLELSPIAPAVFENTNAGRRYGVTRQWLQDAKKAWLEDFDWRKDGEDRINSFPNFKVSVQDTRGDATEIQFLALFSEKPDAVPIAFLHGWPGSVCDFFDILEILRNKYSPKDLPYHVIVPSLPGYAYSSGPSLDSDYGVDIAAGAINNLMVGLGFGSGYLVQGGDLGSFVGRELATNYDSCNGLHLNTMPLPTENPEEMAIDDFEKKALQRASEFIDQKYAFALAQGTRPATIGLVLSSSPLAVLSWIGEKILEWTDQDPPLNEILRVVTLYWMTDTMPRCFWHNRGMASSADGQKIASISAVTNMSAFKLPFIDKPCGFSSFSDEIISISKRWAYKSCRIVAFNQHEGGGHFAAIERPAELLADVEEYVKKAWKVGEARLSEESQV